MALRYIAVSSAGAASETPNSQTTLAAAVSTAIDAATTANGAGGSNADVTTKNQLRRLLDAAYAHVAASNLLA